MSELKENILVSLLGNYLFFNYVPAKNFPPKRESVKICKPGQTNKTTRTVENITLMICWYMWEENIESLVFKIYPILNL